MKRSTSVFIIYFGIIVCTLLLRIATNLGLVNNLTDTEMTIVWDVLVQICIFGIMPFTLYFITNKKGNVLEIGSVFSDFGFKKTKGENFALMIPVTIMLMYVVTCFVVFYSIILRFIGYTKTSSDTEYPNFGYLILELVFTAALPGFFEEFTHRGLLFAGLKDATNKPALLIVFSAVLFGLMHQNIQQVFYTCIAGAVFGLVTYYSGSIWCGMLVHFLNNGFSILQDYLYQKWPLFQKGYDFVFDFLTGNIFGLGFAFTLFGGCVVGLVFTLIHMRKTGKARGVLLDKEDTKKFTKADIAILISTILLGVMATVFSLIWGIMR